MRVLHLINRPHLRGAEQFAARLAADLEENGISNGICSLYAAPGEGTPYDPGDVPMYRLDASRSLFERTLRVDPILALRVRRVIKGFDPDIVVGHGTDTIKYASIARLTSRRRRSVYLNIGKASHWANTRSRVWFNRFWLRNIDSVVSVSSFTREDFIRHYGYDESRTVLIPNAVNVEDFNLAADPETRADTRLELGAGEQDVVIGLVGSMTPEKGHATLIKAVARLRQRGHRAMLVLVGDGEMREELESLCESEGIRDNVSFTGARNDVPRLLAGMDVFAMASVSEGMPGVLIEAGLSGLPAISYDVGGVSEVLAHEVTGLLVQPGQFDDFVDGLDELVARPEWRKQLGGRARSYCRSRFDLAMISGQYIELFSRLMAGKPVGGEEPSATGEESSK